MGADTSQVMVDIETMGTKPGCAIVSIGAVTFTLNSGIRSKFYHEIDVESCKDAGLHVEEDTLEWWDKQDEDVQTVLEGGRDLAGVLEEFNDWFPFQHAKVWANSPSFDCVNLEMAYRSVGVDIPWEFYHQRDMRTIKNLECAVTPEKDGDDHNALDDAKHQARVVRQTLNRIDEAKL